MGQVKLIYFEDSYWLVIYPHKVTRKDIKSGYARTTLVDVLKVKPLVIHYFYYYCRELLQ